MTLRALFLPLLLLPAASPAGALSVAARVNKPRAALNDQILLTVSISLEEASWPQPQMPSIPNFNIHSAGRRNRTNIINGRMSSTVEHDYVLVPRFVGNAVIPPITVTHKGQTVRTDPIQLRILPADTATPTPPAQGAADAPQSAAEVRGEDMFVTAHVDDWTPYVNQQVLMTIRFYLGVPTMGDAQYEFPDTHGFTRENMGTSQPRNVEHKGRPYVLHEIKTALFPIKAGELPIGPTRISARVQENVDMNMDGSDFFRLFFSQSLVGVKQKTVQSLPLRIKARPLPERGKPADFSGAVGRFKINAELQPRTAKVGEAVTLIVTIHGRGNVKTLGDITLPELKEFRTYETLSSLDVQSDDRGIRGSKMFKTVLVPRVSGTLTVPPVRFSYFDPAKREYVSVQTQSIDLNVSPGEAAQAPAVGYQAAVAGRRITRVKSDIRHIKRNAERPLALRLASAVSGALWLHTIPSAIFLISAGLSFRKSMLLKDPVRRRFREARAAAMEKIKRAAGGGEDPGLLADALAGYLADKLGIPSAGLTLREVQKRLSERFPALPQGHLGQLKLLWEELELLRFAPKDPSTGASATEKLSKEVRVLVDALEEAIGS